MIPLPDNTTDRLLAVADIIEFSPDRWAQGIWFADEITNHEMPDGVYGRGFEVSCGSAGCVAGWAVALSTAGPCVDFEFAGAQALGLDGDLAYELFDGSLGAILTSAQMADVLRRLAKLPEGERTIARSADVLTTDQQEAIFGQPAVIFEP